MPQLNPAPWFMILVFSWVIFLTFLPPKIMAHLFPNEPATQNVKKAESHPWTWPWY